MKPELAIQFLEQFNEDVGIEICAENKSDQEITDLISAIRNMGFAAMLDNTGGRKKIVVLEKYETQDT